MSFSLALAQGKNRESFFLTGQFAEPSHKKVYLVDRNNEVVDSARVVANHFTFKGKLAEPDLYWLKLDTNFRRYPVLLENSVMRIKFTQTGELELTGSKLHQQWVSYNATYVDPVREQLIQLSSQRKEALAKGDSLAYKRLMKLNDSLSTYYATHLQDYIAQKPYTPFNLYLLKESGLGDDYVVNMLTEFKPAMGAYPTFKRLEQAMKKRALQRAKLVTGAPAYGFTLPDSTGRLHSLASRQTKVILLDFWASWCGPCIAQFPALRELQSAYGDQGLDIIGISVDDDRQRWLEALRELAPVGLQLSARKNQPLKDKYGIYSIPMVYLLDQKGAIIGINLESAALRRKLDALLSDKP